VESVHRQRETGQNQPQWATFSTIAAWLCDGYLLSYFEILSGKSTASHPFSDSSCRNRSQRYGKSLANLVSIITFSPAQSLGKKTRKPVNSKEAVRPQERLGDFLQ